MAARTASATRSISSGRRAVPFDPRPPAVTSGVRIGSAALATRGLQVEDFAQVGAIIAEAVQPDGSEGRRVELAERPSDIVERYPLYGRIGAAVIS